MSNTLDFHEVTNGMTPEEIGQALINAKEGGPGGGANSSVVTKNYIPEAASRFERTPSSHYMDDLTVPPLMTVGFKRHLSAYAGDCCRIRRASDDAERDIPFDADGIVDVRRMRAFAVNSDIFLVTFYDQSGNGHDLTQSTNSEQPLVILDQLVSGAPYIGKSGAGGVGLTIPGTLSVDQSDCSVWFTLGYANSWRNVKPISIGSTDPFGIGLSPLSSFSVQPFYDGSNKTYNDMKTLPHANSVVGLNSGATLDYYVRDDSYSIAGATSATKSGGVVFNDSNCGWNAATIFSSALGASDIELMQYTGAAEYGKAINPDQDLILIQGDSITQGVTPAFNYSTNLENYLPTDARFFTMGISGQNASSFTSTVNSRIAPLFISGKDNICVNLGGVNELNDGDSAEDLIGYWTDWANAIRAAGGIVVIATLFPRRNTSEEYNTRKDACNEWLRTTALDEGIIDAVCDFDRQTKLLPGWSSDVSPDDLHPSKYGYRIITQVLAETILELL